MKHRVDTKDLLECDLASVSQQTNWMELKWIDLDVEFRSFSPYKALHSCSTVYHNWHVISLQHDAT